MASDNWSMQKGAFHLVSSTLLDLMSIDCSTWTAFPKESLQIYSNMMVHLKIDYRHWKSHAWSYNGMELDWCKIAYKAVAFIFNGSDFHQVGPHYGFLLTLQGMRETLDPSFLLLSDNFPQPIFLFLPFIVFLFLVCFHLWCSFGLVHIYIVFFFI